MKHFFWLSAAAYVVLYFYAAYIYDGFSMTLAIAIFVAVCGLLYWQNKRKAQDAETVSRVDNKVSINTKPLSIWSSPLPYIGIAAVVVLIIGMRL